MFGKSTRTVQRWENALRITGRVSRKRPGRSFFRKFSKAMRSWMFKLYKEKSLLCLSEACEEFEKAWGLKISVTRMWEIIHEQGLKWKVRDFRPSMCCPVS